MNDFRKQLLTLPFISKRADGTLDYWDVATTGHRKTDLAIGRTHAARLAHFYREFSCPNIAAPILEAWATRVHTGQGDIREGFAAEFTSALLCAPADATPGLLTAAALLRGWDGSHPERLPFVSQMESGGYDAWAVRPTGDWSEDTGTGRHYGALLAYVDRARPGDCWTGRVLESMFADLDRFDKSRGLWTGLVTELASIHMASCPCSTAYQRAALPLHQEALETA